VIKEVEVLDGETFIFKEIIEIESFWGTGETVLWPRDEGLMIAGPQNIGKTVIIQNLLLRRIGLGDGRYLGHEIDADADDDNLYLYLAMDRPAQARRSIRRMVADNPVDRGLVQRRLRFWPGPLPLNPAKAGDHDALITWATEYCGRVPAAIFCDSYKDLAVGISKDDVGASINLAVQACIQAGTQWVGAHHHRKSDGQREPRSLDDVFGSTWLTSGLGSVMMAWGEPGSLAIELRQLKSPSDGMNPLQLLHDPESGWVTIDEDEQVEVLTVITRRGAAGITGRELAVELYGGQSRANVAQANREIHKLVREGAVAEVTGGAVVPSRRGGRPASRYRLASFDLPGQGPSAEGLREVYDDGAETG
jgi:replicative DNA helicase